MSKKNAVIKASDQTEILNEDGLCAYLLMKPRTLIEHRKRGLPHIKLSARTILYRRSDIDRWLAARAVSTPLN